MEESNKSFITKHWPQIMSGILLIAAFVEMRTYQAQLKAEVSDLTKALTENTKIEEVRLEKEASRLDDEDDGVRGDMERAVQELKEQMILRDKIVELTAANQLLEHEKGNNK